MPLSVRARSGSGMGMGRDVRSGRGRGPFIDLFGARIPAIKRRQWLSASVSPAWITEKPQGPICSEQPKIQNARTRHGGQAALLPATKTSFHAGALRESAFETRVRTSRRHQRHFLGFVALGTG